MKPLWHLLVTETRVILIPARALIDPQIDGVSSGIYQLPSGESCYWGQVLSLWLWVKAIRFLRPSDNRLSLTDRPLPQHPSGTRAEIEAATKGLKDNKQWLESSHNTRACPTMWPTPRELWHARRVQLRLVIGSCLIFANVCENCLPLTFSRCRMFTP